MSVGAQRKPAAEPSQATDDRSVGLAFAVIVVVALGLRLWDLGGRPLHHDEALDAWFSWKWLTGQGYEYDPIYHGPLRFYLTAGFYSVLGSTVASARLLAALCGAAVCGLPYLLRRQLGAGPMLAAGALLAISPTFLYFSRFGREDSLVALLTFGLVLAVFDLLRRPRPWQPPAIGALLAASFATKETTFITVFIIGSFLLTLLAVELRRAARPRGRARPKGRVPDEGGSESAVVVGSLGLMLAALVSGLPLFVAVGGYGLVLAVACYHYGQRARANRRVKLEHVPSLAAVVEVGARAWLWGLAAFAAVFSVLFSVFLQQWGGVSDGAFDGIGYWLSQHGVNRGGEPWFYYVIVLSAYEWVALALAAIGGVTVLRHRPGPLTWFLIWWAAASLIVYSWAGERFPWLAIHPLLPIVLLAGLGAEVLWQRRREGVARWVAVILTVGLGWTLVTSFEVNYRRGHDPRELLTQTGQAGPDVVTTADRLLELNRRAIAEQGRPIRIGIDESLTWPYGFYLRDLNVDWIDYATTDPDPSLDVVIVDGRHVDRIRQRLPGHAEGQPALHHGWFLSRPQGQTTSYGGAGLSGWASWLVDRTAWEPLGLAEQIVFVRTDLGS